MIESLCFTQSLQVLTYDILVGIKQQLINQFCFLRFNSHRSLLLEVHQSLSDFPLYLPKRKEHNPTATIPVTTK